MRKILKHVTKESQYYPTPEQLVDEIIREWNHAVRNRERELEEVSFLEPCAGDGAICRKVQERIKKAKIDCIEKEPVLQNSLKGQGFNVIASDFEQFNSIPFYNLVIMNPPFSKGAQFLLKAYEVLSGDGEVFCILNAETVRNPYTKERQQLQNLIDRVGEVEYSEGAFSDSERETNVEIAIVHLHKPLYENEFDPFGGVQDQVLTDDELMAQKLKDTVNNSQLISFDKIEHSISIYRNCVKQIFEGINTVQQIRTGLSYLHKQAEEFNMDTKRILEVMFKDDPEQARSETIKTIRKMAWSFVLSFCDMDRYLFTRQRAEFYNRLERGSADLPFTKENIKQFFDNLFYQRQEYFKEGVKDLFEKITSYNKGNNYHGEGWKTNKNWKINKKIIVPWGVEFEDLSKFSSGFFGHMSDPMYKGKSYGHFRTNIRVGEDWIADLDKIVRMVEPKHSDGLTIFQALEWRFRQLGKVYAGEKFDNTCETPYFNLRFFKKGTLHIEFKEKHVLDELNRLGAQVRKDLGYDDWGKKEE